MLFIYNFIQLLALTLLAPFLVLLVVIKAKYRSRIPKRLGFGLSGLVKKIPAGRPRIWIHALSVGEVASAVSLVRAVRKEFPEAVLLFSASTSSGEKFARSVTDFPVDVFVPFPLDIFLWQGAVSVNCSQISFSWWKLISGLMSRTLLFLKRFLPSL